MELVLTVSKASNSLDSFALEKPFAKGDLTFLVKVEITRLLQV